MLCVLDLREHEVKWMFRLCCCVWLEQPALRVGERDYAAFVVNCEA